MVTKKFTLFVLGFVTILTTLYSGPRDFSMLVYNADRDFNGVFIYTIIQDEDGFLWVGGDDGLYRFDGKQMLNLNAKDSAINNLVTASVVSSDGHLFMGYYEGGISIVEHGRYRKIVSKEDLPNKVNRLRSHGEKTIWGLTQNRGLIRVQEDSVTHFKHSIFDQLISYDFMVYQDFIYVATNEGFLELKVEGDQLTSLGFLESTKGLQINSIFQDDHVKNLVWLGTNDGLYSHFLESRDIKPVEGFPAHVQVSSIAKDDLNTLWVGTKNHGLVEVDLNGIEVTAITFFNKQNGFESDQVGEVYVDHENEIWVGTFGRGLVQLNRAYFHHYELYKPLEVQGIHSIANYRKDELILATEQGLVHAYHKTMRDSLIFEPLKYTQDYSFTSILVDGEVVWAGTRDGVIKVNLLQKTIERIGLAPKDVMEHHLIREIVKDNDGNLWISAAGNGVYHIKPSGELINLYNTRLGFYHNEIFAIFPDQAGNVWFGSHATGLALLPKGGEMQFLSKDEIFPAFDINTITQSADGIIWITTEGSGIYRFDGETFKQFTAKDGLLSNYCNAAVVDDIGQIWVGHRLGISLIQPGYDLIRTFHHPGELGETEAELNSVCKDRHGNIFFGNPYGVTKVNLPHFNFKIAKRHTHIKDLRLFYSATDLLKYSGKAKLDDILPSDLTFPYDENHITFDFVSINLRNPEAIYYQYMLVGFDKGWSPVEKSNYATYTNLDPGTYTFRVRESDHEALWDDEYTAITFRVNYPYWEMWWFYLLQIAVITLIVWLTYYLSGRLHNQFAIRLMVYISVFIAFEYVHTELEPYLNSFSGETPIFQVAVNLVLALCLLPIEIRLTRYLKLRAQAVEAKKELPTAKQVEV